MKLNFIWDRCTWASSAIWKDAFRVYSQPQVTYFASEWYVAKIPLECWLGKSQPAKSQQGRKLYDQCILLSYHFLAIIMMPTHSHTPLTLYIVPYNRKLVAFVIDKGKLPPLINSLSLNSLYQGRSYAWTKGGNGPPWPNGKKQNIKYIKHGFEFSCSIFVQYFLTFTKNTLSLFKFSLNFDSFCEFLSGF